MEGILISGLLGQLCKMPLLHKKLFVPNQAPDDLQPEEEVFHCTLTNEIFRDYEYAYFNKNFILPDWCKYFSF